MDEIVRRLRSRNKSSSIRESIDAYHKVLEAEEDEENLGNEEEVETPAPEAEEETPETEATPEETDSEEEAPAEDEEFVDPDGDTEEENKEDEDNHEYVNPLDNPWAVKHTIGEEVLIAYSNGTHSKLKGEIDGYDNEGFYRILWSNGLSTNGITDLALASLVKSQKETNECVCGSQKFVTEGKYVVCDSCGRKIRESQDPLTLADKKRPAGKRLIRSEAHPISTSISETIRNAFKNQTLKESDDRVKLRKLEGKFWTNIHELIEDIEDLGYEVIDYSSEHVLIEFVDSEGDEGEIRIPIVGTPRTMTLDFKNMKFYVGMDEE